MRVGMLNIHRLKKNLKETLTSIGKTHEYVTQYKAIKHMQYI